MPLKVHRPPDYYDWVYRQVDTKEYMSMLNLADGEILDAKVGVPLKVCGDITAEQVGKVHALAALYKDTAYSSIRFITHHDTIQALHVGNGVNPLYARLGLYILGFSTTDGWFLDPWTAYRIAKAKNQIHASIHTDERRALYTHEVLFF